MRYHGLSLVVGLLAIGACAPHRLAVPDRLVDHRIAVKRSGHELTFGEFSITTEEPKSEFQRTSWATMLQDEQVRARHIFGFSLRVRGDVVDEVACERDSFESSHSNGFAVFSRRQHDLACIFTTPTGERRGALNMTARQNVHELRGRLVRAAVSLELTPIEHPAGPDFDTGDAFAPAGYELHVGGVQVGAVETVDGGAVWIDPRAPPWLRKYVALAAAVLLIHRGLEAHGPMVSTTR